MKIMMPHDHTCNCGTVKEPHTPHVIGTNGCVRYMVEAPVKFGKDSWKLKGEEWPISDHSLRQQRGYHEHPCGCWSRWPGSDESITT